MWQLSRAGSSAVLRIAGTDAATGNRLCALKPPRWAISAHTNEPASARPDGSDDGVGVDRSTTPRVHLEVQVGDAGVAGVAHVADHLTGRHWSSDADAGGEPLQVGVEEVRTVGHRNLDTVACERSETVAVDL